MPLEATQALYVLVSNYLFSNMADTRISEMETTLSLALAARALGYCILTSSNIVTFTVHFVSLQT